MNIKLNFITNKIKHIGLRLLLCYLCILLSILFSLWVSIHVTFSVWGIDADSVDFALLYHGFINHGISFITSWRYTQDNWLLSLAPFTFPSYAIFGINKYTLIAPGWVLLVASAFIGGFISYKITNDKILSFYFFVIASLLPGPMSLGNVGFMSYLFSHNSSMFYVILSVLLVSLMIRNQKSTYSHSILYSIIIALVCFVAGISDPWFEAAFFVPALASLLIILFIGNNIIKRLVSFALLSVLIGLLLAYTKLFGLLAFLPKSNFVFVSSIAQLEENFHLYFNSILTFINANYIFSHSYIAGVIYVCLFIVILLYSVVSSAMSVVSEVGYKQFIIYFSFFSIVTVSLAYLLSNFPGGAYSGRFLVNIYYLTLVIITYSIFSKRKKIIVYALSLSFFTAYVAFSLLQSYPMWIKINLSDTNNTQSGLINFLYTHDLKYGYGGYWATNANAVAIISNYKVIIRPVSYEPVINKKNNIPSFPQAYIIGNHPLSSPLWYEPSNSPPHNNEFLVISAGGESSELFNNSIKMSKKLAIEQFGTPTKIYEYENKIILVWNKNLDLDPLRSPRYKNYLNSTFSTLYNSSVTFLSKGNAPSKLLPQYLEEHGYLDKSFGYETGPAANWTKNNGWIGQWTCPDGKGVCFGVGLTGNINNLKPIIEKYKPQALQVFFPYPKVYAENSKDTNGQLLIVFRSPK